jgi:hypothetical protein
MHTEQPRASTYSRRCFSSSAIVAAAADEDATDANAADEESEEDAANCVFRSGS